MPTQAYQDHPSAATNTSIYLQIEKLGLQKSYANNTICKKLGFISNLFASAFGKGSPSCGFARDPERWKTQARGPIYGLRMGFP
jgi:hypothetical protein